MAIEIVFRGVAMFVCGRGNTTVTKVLFPNAEGKPDEGTKDTDGFKHADKTRATPHYAGLLIPRPDGDEYHKLLGVDVNFISTGDAIVDGTFIDSFPSLKKATNREGYELELLPLDKEEPSVDGRVATRIKPLGGRLTALEKIQAPFSIDGHHTKDDEDIPGRPYSPGAKWTPVGTLPSLDIVLTDRTAQHKPPKTITLGRDSKAFFYNFENGIPTQAQLEHVDHDPPCEGHLIDHDWKWLYGLMARKNTTDHPNWPEWLKSGRFHRRHEFPAPKARCEDMRLVSVSTCFQTVLGDE